MKGIKKVFQILPSKLNKYIYVFIILLLISSFFELLSISVLIPIVEIIINGYTSIDFINSKLINYQKEFSLNQILISSLFFCSLPSIIFIALPRAKYSFINLFFSS